MSSGLNYAKAARRARTLRACRDHPADTDKPLPRVRPVQGWRTEYPEQFPVTVTKLADRKDNAA